MPQLSIVLPCYNESENISFILSRFRDVLKGRKDVEVILVNNGSTDDSDSVLERELESSENSFARHVNVEVNQGYGYGIMAGIREAGGNVLAWTHADMQTDPKDVLNAFEQFGNDLESKERIVKGKRIKRNFFDAFFTAGMSLVSTLTLGCKLADINAQPKMFHRSFLSLLKQPPNDFSLDLYLLYVARKSGLKILELPVSFAKRQHGISKGGGSLSGKFKLIKRTFRYIFQLRREIREGMR